MQRLIGFIFFFVFAVISSYPVQADDEFLTRVYDNLNSSPAQEKFRKIAPIPVGCVYIQRPGEGEKEIRRHFQTMKKLGFTATRQIMPTPGWTFEQIALIALEEGIIPWWYGEGGWEAINDDLLEKLGIPPSTPIARIRTNLKMVAYQTAVLRKRIEKMIAWKSAGKSTKFSAPVHKLGGIGPELTDEGKALFIDWVKQKYQTIEKLNWAWNQDHFGLTSQEGKPFQLWADFEARWEQVNRKEFRHLRDIFRFKADDRLRFIRYKIIYLPAILAIPKDILEFLSDYVKAGGRLVLDMPGVYYDDYGRLLFAEVGTTFEKTFGVIINEYQGAGINVPYQIDSLELEGFVVDLAPTRAQVLAEYDNGQPAITEVHYGQGTAVLLGYEASMLCFQSGNDLAEAMLLDYTLGDYASPFQCDGAIVYRLATAKADHYFLINDGPRISVHLDLSNYRYSQVMDAVTGMRLKLRAPIEIARYSGRWLRYTAAN